MEEEDEEQDSKINEASMKGNFPGEPINDYILVKCRHDVACHIRNDKKSHPASLQLLKRTFTFPRKKDEELFKG